MLSLQGTVQKSEMGAGTWTLVASTGETYEIHRGAPQELLQNGLKVQVEGTVRQDVMTTAMIGPVLEVKRFEVIS